MKKVLVTGGAGFIGSHIVDRLLKEGYEVRILDNLQPRVHPKGKPVWISKDVEFIKGDVRNKEILKKALTDVQVVFHQAAYQDYMPDFSTFLHVNSVSTALIQEIILEQRRGSDLTNNVSKKLEKVIVASSQAVYGEGQYQCLNRKCQPPYTTMVQPDNRSQEQLNKAEWEHLCPSCREPMTNLRLKEEYHNPYNAYAISKLAEEMTAVRLGKLHGIPSVALRYSIVQGPRQSLYNQYSGICRIFCLRLLNNLPPIIYEDGLQKRDYTHILDVVEANMLVMNDQRADFQVFNVGSGIEITVQEYANKLINTFNKDLQPQVTGEYRLGDNRHSISDISKLMSLGWSPKYGLDKIFEDYINWIQTHCDLGEYFRDAEIAMRELGVVNKISCY